MSAQWFAKDALLLLVTNWIAKTEQAVHIAPDKRPALVAQLDVRATGDQEFAGLAATGLAAFFPGD